MNENSSTTVPNTASNPQGISQAKRFVRDNLVATITATVAGSLLMTGASAVNIWTIYNSFESTVSKQFKLQKLTGELVYQDEYLTMATEMLVGSGDLKWEERYKKILPAVDITNKEFAAIIPVELKEEAKKTEASTVILLGLEEQILKLVREGKKQEADLLLHGEQYTKNKQIFGDQNKIFLTKVDESIKKEISNYQQQLWVSIIIAGATLPILLAVWTFVIAAVRDYIRDRAEAQAAIERSQADMLQLNTQLAQEVETRSQKEQQIRQESETLQTDIGHILDVVCALEEGDLRVQAEVNDRATGLISDTLNRLTESLDRIISAAVDTTQQVTLNASEIELLAMETARKAKSQTTEVRAVQSLMDDINQLTIDSRQQAIATATAVEQAKSAVSSGRSAIQDTATGIETLQQGTEQIVRRAQLLNEFVDLAAQFSKEQKRVAALTRVLALNVSTLSNRAIDERDPAQFASLAKEFATIATQVNTLATDTDRSLISLQQRTDSVQTVTSGLAQDITEIEQLVQKFTAEVGKSRQAFDNIQSVTEEVDKMSARVNASSQDIVNAVINTLGAIRSISEIAQSTESKAAITQAQVQSMGDLAAKLLQMVEFFQLSQPAPTDTTKQLAKV